MEVKVSGIKDYVPEALLAKERLRNKKEKEKNPSAPEAVLTWYRDSLYGGDYKFPVTQIGELPEEWPKVWTYRGSQMMCIYRGSKDLLKNHDTKRPLNLPTSLQRILATNTGELKEHLALSGSKEREPAPHIQYDQERPKEHLKTHPRWFVGDRELGQRIMMFGPEPLDIRVAAPDLCMEDRLGWFWEGKTACLDPDVVVIRSGCMRINDGSEETAKEVAKKLNRYEFQGHAGVVHPCSNAKDCLSLKLPGAGNEKIWWSCEACVQAGIENIRQNDPSLMQGFLTTLCSGCATEACKKYPYPEGYDGCDCPARQNVDNGPWLCFLCRVNELRMCRVRKRVEDEETRGIVESKSYLESGRDTNSVYTAQSRRCPTITTDATIGNTCPCGNPTDKKQWGGLVFRCAGCLGIVHHGFPDESLKKHAQENGGYERQRDAKKLKAC